MTPCHPLLDGARALQMLVSALLAQAKGFACDPRTPAHEAAGYRLALAAQLKGMGLALAQVGGVNSGGEAWRAALASMDGLGWA